MPRAARAEHEKSRLASLGEARREWVRIQGVGTLQTGSLHDRFRGFRNTHQVSGVTVHERQGRTAFNWDLA